MNDLHAAWEPIENPADLTKKGFYIGSAGYNFADWVGRFYPPRFSTNKFLEFYQVYFQFVELDHVHQPKLRPFYEEIANQSRGNMCYGIRIPRELACPENLTDPTMIKRMQLFVNEISPLVECGRLYSLLLQVSGAWSRTQARFDYLCSVASVALNLRLDVHFEFRNRSWHDFEILNQMRDRGIGICNTEVPSRSAFPCRPYCTTDKGYTRYLGRNFGGWKKLMWQKDSKERAKQKEGLFDYLYREEEIQEKVVDQIKLARKVSKLAVVFCNCPRAQSVVNSVQNIRQIQSYFDIQKIAP
jgi:uncharacterized protein YecE (DUF72 family)